MFSKIKKPKRNANPKYKRYPKKDDDERYHWSRLNLELASWLAPHSSDKARSNRVHGAYSPCPWRRPVCKAVALAPGPCQTGMRFWSELSLTFPRLTQVAALSLLTYRLSWLAHSLQGSGSFQLVCQDRQTRYRRRLQSPG